MSKQKKAPKNRWYWVQLSARADVSASTQVFAESAERAQQVALERANSGMVFWEYAGFVDDVETEVEDSDGPIGGAA